MKTLEKVSEFIQSRRLFDPEVLTSSRSDAAILVGLSGGSDSVATLFVLRRLGYRVRAIHFNFGIRGEEADRDELFCQRLAAEWHVPFLTHRFDAPRYAREHKLSLEMACRELRYDYWQHLHETDASIRYVAIGHHQDDSVETILINLMRGTGAAGLQGISPIRDFYRRPLLCLWREEITALLEENGIAWVTDSTNLANDYTRNKVRNQLLPLMRQINPNAAHGIATTATRLSDAQRFYDAGLAQLRDLWLTEVSTWGIPHKRVDLPAMSAAGASAETLATLLRDYRLPLSWPQEIFEAFRNHRHTVFETPGFYSFVWDDGLHIADLSRLPSQPVCTFQTEEGRWKMEDGRTNSSPFTIMLDADKVRLPLRFRRWEKADRIAPLGMGGKKKLVSDLFTNAHYSPIQKLATWILVDADDRILWVAGLRVSELSKVDESTRTVIRVTLQTEAR